MRVFLPADKHPSYDCLMLRRILPYDKYARSIQPSPVKNGAPFRPKVIYRKNVLARVLRYQFDKRLLVIPTIKRNSHVKYSLVASIECGEPARSASDQAESVAPVL